MPREFQDDTKISEGEEVGPGRKEAGMAMWRE